MEWKDFQRVTSKNFESLTPKTIDSVFQSIYEYYYNNNGVDILQPSKNVVDTVRKLTSVKPEKPSRTRKRKMDSISSKIKSPNPPLTDLKVKQEKTKPEKPKRRETKPDLRRSGRRKKEVKYCYASEGDDDENSKPNIQMEKVKGKRKPLEESSDDCGGDDSSYADSVDRDDDDDEDFELDDLEEDDFDIVEKKNSSKKKPMNRLPLRELNTAVLPVDAEIHEYKESRRRVDNKRYTHTQWTKKAGAKSKLKSKFEMQLKNSNFSIPSFFPLYYVKAKTQRGKYFDLLSQETKDSCGCPGCHEFNKGKIAS